MHGSDVCKMMPNANFYGISKLQIVCWGEHLYRCQNYCNWKFGI